MSMNDEELLKYLEECTKGSDSDSVMRLVYDRLKVLRETSLSLPKIIHVRDYHDFKFIESILHDMGLNNVSVAEVGFDEPLYVGVVHTNEPEHKTLIRTLEQKYADDGA